MSRCGIALAAMMLAVGPGGCAIETSSDAQGITSGVEIENQAAVVGLVDDGEVFCTGTLISPTAVLTAGHCIQPVDRPPPQVFFGASVEDGGELLDAVELAVHPDFRYSPLSWDLALVFLPEPARVSPLPILERGLGDWLVGQEVRVVGYGLPSAFGGEPVKREGYAVVESIDDTTFRVAPSPSQPCRGDSGGPAFLDTDDGSYLIGVVSKGDFGCNRYAEFTRVDSEPGEFLDEYLADGGGCRVADGGEPSSLGWLLVAGVLALRRKRRKAPSHRQRLR